MRVSVFHIWRTPDILYMCPGYHCKNKPLEKNAVFLEVTQFTFKTKGIKNLIHSHCLLGVGRCLNQKNKVQ